jgi:hypothetical protein
VRFRLAVAAGFAVTVAALPAAALDDDGEANLYGPGASPCAAYTGARKAASAGNFEEWLDGYLSAVNLVLPDTYDILGDKKRAAAAAWLDVYCAGNPDDPFGFAANRLAAYLYPNRHASKPVK